MKEVEDDTVDWVSELQEHLRWCIQTPSLLSVEGVCAHAHIHARARGAMCITGKGVSSVAKVGGQKARRETTLSPQPHGVTALTKWASSLTYNGRIPDSQMT